MDSEICIDDAVFKMDQDTLTIQRKNGFFSLNNCIYGSGIGMVRSILNHSIAKNNQNFIEDPERYMNGLLEDKNVLKPAAAMITTVDIDKTVILTCDNITAIVTADLLSSSTAKEDDYNVSIKTKNRFMGSINTMIILNEDLSYKTLLNSFMTVTKAKIAALWDLDVRSPSSGDIATGSVNDSTIIACVGEKIVDNVGNNAELQISLGKCVREATGKIIKKCGFPRTILDFIDGLGVKIQDLVSAGMELCVGVDVTEDLYIELEKEILKALEDINVVSFIIAGARLEEDYAKGRIQGINVDDDPAFLYSDEVMGMAIANQIAGTKAIFNFKRYDEVKPGIIGDLGPVLDDIFAGIVAGCMSKIFEE